ncbi:MAG TPA: DUF3800 domain-containing protein [Gaiellaceae bacterium]|nr:DUF3800 domain-containing protein [Gaiellaceae bacterium]
MADKYVFADEAGNFDFSTSHGATRYFVLATVTLDDCQVGKDLIDLRRSLAWDGVYLDRVFHATEDEQAVRDRVFDLLASAVFRVDATILEKRKTQPHLQSDTALYKMAWYLHFKYVAPRIVKLGDRLLVTAATLGTKRRRGIFHRAVDDVGFQVSPTLTHRVAFWPYESDPCLQIADYCTWAIQRKWEGGDPRSHALIASKIKSEYDVFAPGKTHYY